MKRKLICLLAVLFFLTQINSCVFAQKPYKKSNSLNIAIRKYKRGNYTGCLQDCQTIVQKNPSNATAYYYLAMSYVQAGKKDEAIKYYSKVLSLKSNPKLLEYATTGKRCLETPDKCSLEPTTQNDMSEIDKFIASPPADGLSPAVRKDFQQKRLENVKNEINKDKELDDYNFRKFKDSSQNSPEIDGTKIAQKPTEDQIKAALKVLSDAGVPPEQYLPYQTNPNYKNPELTELNAMMGNNNSQNNNAMMNMLPFMLAQDKNGSSNLSPQIMQTMILNSMMTDFTYDTDKDK